jgi:hypothetical protein
MIMTNEAQLQEQLTNAAAWVKEQLRRADLGSNFTLTIEIAGPIQQEEGVRLIYKLDHSRNYDSSVSGNSLTAVTFEMLRRSGWKDANAGVLLEWKNGAGAPSLEGNE